jgi:hypothetical protein
LPARSDGCAAIVWDRLPGSYHGSGCTLASAIAAYLASGCRWSEAVRPRRNTPGKRWRPVSVPGMGQFMPDRFFRPRWRWSWLMVEPACAAEQPSAARPLRDHPGLPGRDAPLERVGAALQGGAAIVQYRDKGGDAARRAETARALLSLCRQFGARLLINDDLALALAVGADGVHLGAADGELRRRARRWRLARLLGASCYDDFERARAAVSAGADYLAFGAMHPSSTKPLAVRARCR